MVRFQGAEPRKQAVSSGAAEMELRPLVQPLQPSYAHAHESRFPLYYRVRVLVRHCNRRKLAGLARANGRRRDDGDGFAPQMVGERKCHMEDAAAGWRKLDAGR